MTHSTLPTFAVAVPPQRSCGRRDSEQAASCSRNTALHLATPPLPPQVVGEQHRMVNGHMRRLLQRGAGLPEAEEDAEEAEASFDNSGATLGPYPTLIAKVAARWAACQAAPLLSCCVRASSRARCGGCF